MYLYTLQMGMNLRIVYLFNEYFLIYSNPAKLRKAEWNPSKIKEHDSHSRQWLGQCLGQKGRRDENVDVSVVQSMIMYMLQFTLVVFFLYSLKGIFVPLPSELNPKYLQSLSVKSFVKMKN